MNIITLFIICGIVGAFCAVIRSKETGSALWAWLNIIMWAAIVFCSISAYISIKGYY